MQRDGELVIDYQGRNEHISELSEQEITNALQRLGRKQSKLIVFLEGHGERNPHNFANFDYSEWATQLKNRGFKIETVNLSKKSQLPEKTDVLVLSSPEVNILPERSRYHLGLYRKR
ncbi:MAG: Gldg family protein [Thiotrichaceae bacterium]